MEYEPCLLLGDIQIEWPIPNSVDVYYRFEGSVLMYSLAHVSRLIDHVSRLIYHVSRLLARVSQLLVCARVKIGYVGLFPLLIV